ncbi:K Homology domain-containing protein [Caenorhabditis elegans]|nr:K Homology domain-containing protein [Caenorhabditis elegans]CCD61630.1 K Homology domain-containing protein [Caenorhabditis elegans]|eukprot:NP_001023001.1 FUBp (FUBP) Like [Caenorhabditis elegans]
MGDSDKITDIYPVPEKVVGLVIGKGGSEIRLIQQTSGCRVQMDPDHQSVNGFRNCTIEGPPDQVAVARQMITQVINRNQTGAQPGAAPGEVTEEMLIPADKIGLVIGKGGETIRIVQEQSGLRNCNVVQETTTATGQPKPLRMIGSPAAIETAKALVHNIMNNTQGNAPLLQRAPHQPSGQFGGGYGAQEAQAKGEVIVPRLSAGMIIGKGGEMIKRLAAETGTKIQFKPDTNPNSEDRIAVIMGTRDQIYRATERITEIVNRAIKNNGAPQDRGSAGTVLPGQSIFYMHVPAGKCGLVIGKGGENIKQIERETGATCGLAPAAEQKNEDEKVFEIKGSQLQIHHASHLVRIKVGEISPNTPVPPLQGAGGGYQQQQAMFSAGTQNGGYQSTGGFIQQQQQPQFQHQQQQWAPQNGGGVQQRLPTEMYQNPMQQPQASVIPQASADPAPAVNPATGAPDYSAQWAAYYRSIGLVEQAAMVESQMRRNQSNTAPLGDVSGVPQSQQPYYPQ